MATEYKKEKDGSITIVLNFKPEGSMLEQEEQIAKALSDAGRIATELTMKSFDTDGKAVIVKNEKYTSRGEEKKTFKRRGVK